MGVQQERGKDCMNYIKELLFPRRCAVCDNIVGIGEKICTTCEEKVELIRGAWCCKCGKPLEEEQREYCYDCEHRKHYYTRGRAVFAYDSIAQSIYRFKYCGRQEYAEYYGYTVAEYLQGEKEMRQAQALIPVPLHPARKRKRGYNQAFLIAKALGKEWGIPVRDDLIVKTRNIKPLKLLNPSERQNYLKKAFKIVQNDVKLKKIIIIDDIYTTGSTIDAVSREFLEAGVKEIYFITLAAGKGLQAASNSLNIR